MKGSDESARIELAVQQPWTVLISRDDDNGYVARVEEIPDAIATGETIEALERDLWESIRESIRARIAFGDPIPSAKRGARIRIGRAVAIPLQKNSEVFERTAGLPMLVCESTVGPST